jgi:Zn-finger nucleic acid-binding protein/uncharacterized protein YxjI
MQCPACHSDTLGPVKNRPDYAYLDSCSSCQGIWFDGRELEDSLNDSIDSAFAHAHGRQPSNRHCPRCRVRLVQFAYPATTVMVDGCTRCHGVWLDRGEWQQINSALAERAEINCPKCQTLQADALTCKQCGLVFAKYHQRQQAQQQLADDVLGMFEDATAYQVKQQVEWLEVLSPFERLNRYEVAILGSKVHGGYVIEHSRSLFNMIGRQLLGRWRPARLLLNDIDGREILRIHKPFRLYFHQLDMSTTDGRRVGTIRRTFHLFRATYTVMDAQRRVIMTIRGPFFYSPFVDRVFRIFRGKKEIGDISKKWRATLTEYFTDADTFNARIDRGLPVTEKMLLFGAVFLIDFVSFENNRNG